MDHLRGVDARGLHALDVVVVEAVEALHHQHAARHQLRVRTRHDDDGLAGIAQHVRDVEHVLRLEPEVELLGDRLGEQLDERRRIRQRRHGDPPDEPRRDPRHRRQIPAHEARDLRPLHLDDDILAGREARGVHLRNRRGRERRSIEAGEHGLERLAQILFDDAADDVERLGRHAVAKLLELPDELAGKQAPPRRNDLPELDVRRPQAFEGLTQPQREGCARSFAPAAALADLPGQERAPDPDPGRCETAQRRQFPSAHPVRHLRLARGAQPDDLPAPRHLVGIDQPGAVLTERETREILHERRLAPPLGTAIECGEGARRLRHEGTRCGSGIPASAGLQRPRDLRCRTGPGPATRPVRRRRSPCDSSRSRSSRCCW